MTYRRKQHLSTAVVLSLSATLLTPAFALAAGGDNSSIVSMAAFQLVNSVILIGLIVFFARKPFKAFLTKRKADVCAELDEARSLHEEAKSMLDEYRSKLDGLDAEKEQLLAEYRALGEAEKAKIIADAEHRAGQMAREAEQTIAQEIAAAKAALEAEVVSLASDLAEDAMRKNLTDKQHTSLIDGFLTDLERTQTTAN